MGIPNATLNTTSKKTAILDLQLKCNYDMS